MKRSTVLAAIAAASILALGGAATVWAHEPAPAADLVCGEQGEQQSENNDDFLCGQDETNATPGGQSGTAETGSMENGQSGGAGQQGEQQEGEN